MCQWEQRNTRYPICTGNIELTNYIQSLNDGVLQETHIIRDFVYDPEFCQTKCFGNYQHPVQGDFSVTSQNVLHLWHYIYQSDHVLCLCPFHFRHLHSVTVLLIPMNDRLRLS